MSQNTFSKIILVTGSSSGIGEATTRLLAAEGARVILAARRTDRLEQIVADIRKAGGTAACHALDVTDPVSFRNCVAFAEETFGPIDVLINNAGVMPLSPLSALKLDEWNRMIDVNIRGVLHGIAAVLPGMEERERGHIINVSSIAGYHVWPACAVYSGTKFAVRAISEGLRLETKTVRVTVVSPGVVESELAHTITHPETAAFIDAFRAVALQPETIARGIAYAISQSAEVDVNELIIRPTAGDQ